MRDQHPARRNQPRSRPASGLRLWLWLALTIVSAGSTHVLQSGQVYAWGRFGHRASARLAELRLSPAAKAAVAKLLEPDETLADASTWADDQRRSMPETGPWHYVNVPITEDHYSPRFCPEKEGCVVGKIDEFRKGLADPGRSVEERRKALKFLVHFVQDMHMPLHVGDRRDRGGNDLQVQFFGQGSNLHRVWDSAMIERRYEEENDVFEEIKRLAAVPEAGSWSNGMPEDWATESLQLAKQAYVQPFDKTELRSGAKLGLPYQDANLPAAMDRVARSGVRLASMLNAIFSEPDPAQ